MILSGTEYVLIAQVPRAGDRWHQVHLNMKVVEEFFGIRRGRENVLLVGVRSDGSIYSSDLRPFVHSEINRNPRIEFTFESVGPYPSEGAPILTALEMAPRRVLYTLLLPDHPDYAAVDALNKDLPRFGRGLKRSRTNLDRLEDVWPRCPFRKAAKTWDET